MDVGPVDQDASGLWRVSVWPGHADVLASALDPDAPFILIETGDGVLDWHEAVVAIGPDGDARTRLVRHHRFDVLVSRSEAIEIGSNLRAQGLLGGGFGCYQFRSRPRADFRVPDSPQAKADAMRGQGVELCVDLPHDGEVAVVLAPISTTLDRFRSRLI